VRFARAETLGQTKALVNSKGALRRISNSRGKWQIHWGLDASHKDALRIFPAPPGRRRRETRLQVVTPPPARLEESPLFAISPNGRQLVFVARTEAKSQLWVRSLQSETAHPLPAAETPNRLRQIGYLDVGFQFKMTVIGGTFETIELTRNRWPSLETSKASFAGNTKSSRGNAALRVPAADEMRTATS
jgi:hypothetical protein